MKEQQNKKDKTLRADLLLIGAVLLLAAILFTIVLLRREKGGTVQVYIDGKLTAQYPLSENREVELQDADGNVINTFMIKDGAVSMTYADCPDKTCVHMREIRYAGETIICLPHKTELRVKGGEASDVDIH